MGDYITEKKRNSVKVIIGVAYRESNFNQKAQGNHSGDHLGVKPAVFVTKNRAMRLKATIVKVAAIAMSMIKKVLITPRRKSDFKK